MKQITFSVILSQSVGSDSQCLSPLKPSSQFELPHDKTNKIACAPSNDSDQPGRPPSLIRVFAVGMKKAGS